MKLFQDLFYYELSKSECNILDLGGTYNFWKQIGYLNNSRVRITLLNLQHQDIISNNITSVEGDACNISQFPDKSFDIVFSNSVIEHVGNMDRQKQMANEVSRVGRAYFIQTPNFWFPMEPHFLVPGFQFFPLRLQVCLLMNFNVGWGGKRKDRTEAKKIAESIRLLTQKDLKFLFPDARIYKERFAGFAKSLIAVRTI